MRYLLALVLLVGVAPSAPTRAERLEDLRGAVCKVVIPFGGHGSGVAYGNDGTYVYILTAGHVTDAIPQESKRWRFSVIHSWGETDIQEQAEFYRRSSTSDLAVIRVYKGSMRVASLGQNSELSSGAEVLALGYPENFTPSLVSYGFILSNEDDGSRRMTRHTAEIRFGNSGGPLVNFNTLEIVGINVQFSNISQPWRSDRVEAVSIKDIYTFLTEVHKDSIKPESKAKISAGVAENGR